MNQSAPPIKIVGLVKNYASLPAVKGVDFELGKKEILGLIGPDGAGKTSIIRTVVSLLQPTSGRVYFMGRDVQDDTAFVRAHIGYMPQRFSLYQDLTVAQNLHFFGDLFKVSVEEQEKRIAELYAFSRLGPFKNRLAGQLSGGMKQKLALSCMLIHQPEVIVLDEPTFGVDPVSRAEFWEILHTLSDDGVSILVSTAYMDEAVQCDRVGLMFDGRLLSLDKPQNITAQFTDPLINIRVKHPHVVLGKLERVGLGAQTRLFGEGLHFTDLKKIGRDGLIKILQDTEIEYAAVDEIAPSLEDVFLKLMEGEN